MPEMLAAVDCGTNSTRLLVSEGGERTVERLMRITRLGQGVDATGALVPEAVQRTLEVLRDFRQVIHGIQSSVSLPSGNHNPALVPPLELTRRDAGKGDHFLRCKISLH